MCFMKVLRKYSASSSSFSSSNDVNDDQRHRERERNEREKREKNTQTSKPNCDHVITFKNVNTIETKRDLSALKVYD